MKKSIFLRCTRVHLLHDRLDIRALGLLNQATDGRLCETLQRAVALGAEPIIEVERRRERPPAPSRWFVVAVGRLGDHEVVREGFEIPISRLEGIAVVVRIHLHDIEAEIRVELLAAVQEEDSACERGRPS